MLLLYFALFVWTFLYTPSIKGTVIDSETKKPIEGARIKVEWVPWQSELGRPTEIRETTTIVTNSSGEFKVEKFVKYFSDPLNWLELFIYAHGYEARTIRWYPKYKILGEVKTFTSLDEERKPLPPDLSDTTIQLQPLKTAREWAENYNFLQSELEEEMIYNKKTGEATFRRDPEEEEFLKEEEKIYEEKFKNKSGGKE